MSKRLTGERLRKQLVKRGVNEYVIEQRVVESRKAGSAKRANNMRDVVWQRLYGDRWEAIVKTLTAIKKSCYYEIKRLKTSEIVVWSQLGFVLMSNAPTTEYATLLCGALKFHLRKLQELKKQWKPLKDHDDYLLLVALDVFRDEELNVAHMRLSTHEQDRLREPRKNKVGLLLLSDMATSPKYRQAREDLYVKNESVSTRT